MRKLAQAGTGIVLVTHHLPDIIPEIDRVILMSRGRVAADGRKPEILTADRLGSLFSMPVDLAERNGHYNLW
jgi:iron complex transport system ATP-binding protein